MEVATAGAKLSAAANRLAAMAMLAPMVRCWPSRTAMAVIEGRPRLFGLAGSAVAGVVGAIPPQWTAMDSRSPPSSSYHTRAKTKFDLPKKARDELIRKKMLPNCIPAGSGGLLIEISPNPTLYYSECAAGALYYTRVKKGPFFELT